MIETIDMDLHPGEEEFMDYLYQEMTADQAKGFLAHLDTCPECGGTLTELRMTMGMLDQLDDEDNEDHTQNPSIHLRSDDAQEPDSLMTPLELSAFLSIPEDAVYDLLSQLPHINLAGNIRFRRQSIEQWLQSRELNSPFAQKSPVDRDISPFLWRRMEG